MIYYAQASHKKILSSYDTIIIILCQLRAKVFINLVSYCPWQFVEVSITTTQYCTNFLHIWSSHLTKLMI